MIQSFIQTLKTIATKPGIVLPATVLNIALIGISAWTAEKFAEVFINSWIALNSAQVSLFELPFRIFQINPAQTAELAVGLLTITYLTFLMFYICARFIREQSTGKNASILTAVKYSLAKLKELFYLLLFFVFAGILIATAYQVILILTLGIQILGIIAAGILFLLFLYLFVKFLVLIPILSDGKITLKNGLKKSWEFTGRHFLSCLAVLAGISIYSFIFERAMTYTAIATNNEILLASISIILYGILSTFTFCYVSEFYFQKHKQEKQTTTSTDEFTD